MSPEKETPAGWRRPGSSGLVTRPMRSALRPSCVGPSCEWPSCEWPSCVGPSSEWPSCAWPSCEWPSCARPSFVELPFLGHPPVRLPEHRDVSRLANSEAANRLDVARGAADAVLPPPIGDRDTRLEGNLPPLFIETAVLEQLLRVTLTPVFLARQGTSAKKSSPCVTELRATNRFCDELGCPSVTPLTSDRAGVRPHAQLTSPRQASTHARPIRVGSAVPRIPA
jgi:hypothetical protein